MNHREHSEEGTSKSPTRYPRKDLSLTKKGQLLSTSYFLSVSFRKRRGVFSRPLDSWL